MGRYEQVSWSPRFAGMGSRSDRRPLRIACYVPDPIAAWDPPLTGALAAIIGDADGALRELDQAAPGSAGLEAIARQLLRQEAVASSRIEGLAIGQRRLARAAIDDGTRDAAAAQIVGNIRAMEHAIDLGSANRPFALADLVEIHRVLMTATPDDHLAGRIRDVQNWIGGTSLSPARAQFIPPPPAHVPGLLDDLVAFVNRTDLQACLQAAAAHAQFETIHPFIDGNGRVGRCLIHVVLRRAGVSAAIVPPVSAILAGAAADYVRGLTAWRGPAPLDWCAQFAAVATTAADEAWRLASLIDHLQARWTERAGGPRRDSATRTLIGRLPGEPIVTVGRAAQLAGCSVPAATRAIERLEAAGILRRLGTQRRGRRWEAPDVFALVDRFERDLSGRPGMPELD